MRWIEYLGRSHSNDPNKSAAQGGRPLIIQFRLAFQKKKHLKFILVPLMRILMVDVAIFQILNGDGKQVETHKHVGH